MRRREFLQSAGAGLCAAAQAAHGDAKPAARPNLVYVFADQWRAQAFGYAGDPNARTPHIDRLAGESVRFQNAVSTCPVCSPYRGCLMTGKYPLSHGVFLNDVPLSTHNTSIAEAFNAAGYRTGYIGKWHVDGHGRSDFIPRERRRGFQFWNVLECTHDYNHSVYYGDTPERKLWEGYDVFAQTRAAQRYIESSDAAAPFALFLSWGPPHNPYETAPAEYRARFKAEDMQLRPNVPASHAAQARKDLAGYYAHCAAMDTCIGDLLATLEKKGIADNTIFVFTSDHGDMLESQGMQRKQKPWDESAVVPFMLRHPRAIKPAARVIHESLSAPDIMPTMLGMCGVTIPRSVQGQDLSDVILAKRAERDTAALLACYTPFGEWHRKNGGREYRGVRTPQHTYVRTLDGPWLLYDNKADPYQQKNLCGKPEHAALQNHLEDLLRERLAATNDAFLPGTEYLAHWGYKVDETGTASYSA